jgi:NAD(P)-dependent dehydrogenase (short-subunit alcohol dehydrogenase family)
MSDSLFSVQDQVVLVSGASRGIGRAIAQGFAERGAHVIITGRDQTTLESTAQALTPSHHPVQDLVCDVAQPNEIEGLVHQVDDIFGHIDTLINVAGINRRKPALDMTPSDYDDILGINLKGAFHLSQAVAKIMIRKQSGSHINIASLNTDRPLKNVAPYAMSKAGLGAMTRALALEWGPYGLRINALAPGFVLTDLTRKLWSDPTMNAWGKTNTPLQRLAQPEDMIGTALFLASPASAFLTGQILYVDGGFTAGWSWPIPPHGGQPQ